MRKTRLIVLLIIGIFFLSVTTIAEEITLTTYYPAPYGEYENLYVSGNVGIGTATPGAKLDVQSTGASTKPLRVLNSVAGRTDFEIDIQGDNRPWLRMYQTGTERIRLDVGDLSFFNGGNVGIGTTGPIVKLDVRGGTILQGRLELGNADTNWINDTIAGFAEPVVINDAFILVPGFTGIEDSDLRLYILDNSADRFSIWGGDSTANINSATLKHYFTSGGNVYHAGNVGIGTPSPTNLLHVNGNPRFADNFNPPSFSNNGEFAIAYTPGWSRLYWYSNGVRRYANSDGSGDYSEYMLSKDQDLEFGEIVSIGGFDEQQGGVIRTTKAKDRNILGVISDGGTRNNDPDGNRYLDPNYKLVALLGITSVKVDTENGAIQVGDYITSSTTPGVGMKADPLDPIVGIALKSYSDSGIGKIKILLNRNNNFSVLYLEERIKNQQREIEGLMKRLAALEERLR